MAGAIVDRYERRRLMILCDFVRGAVLAAVTLLYLAGVLVPWHLLVAAFLLSTGTRLFNPAKQAIVRLRHPLENAPAAASGSLLKSVGEGCLSS